MFREIARQGGISAAANTEHLSQPAVTQALDKLEAQLGVALIERRRGNMAPTEIGGTYLKRVVQALDHLNAGARDAVRLGTRQSGGARRGFAEFDRLITAAQLRVLVAMSDARNFSIAARNTGISQPTIHRSARNLEKLSGLTLFTKSPEGISLTLAAQALAQRAKLALVELRQGSDEIGKFLGRDSTHIVVGAMPLARTQILPTAIDGFVKSTDRVQIRVIEGPYSELLSGLRTGNLDMLIGALRNPPPVDDVIEESLFDDPLAIVAGASHPLAKRTAVTLDDTLAYPWVAPPRETPAGSYLYETLRIGDRPRTPVRVVSSSLILLRGLLVSGDYITIISLHQVAQELRDGLVVPLAVDLRNNSRAIGLTVRRDWRPTQTQARFLDLLREASKNRVDRLPA